MKKVLIVEDQKEVRELLDIIFRKQLGFQSITFASDGLEGYAEAYLQKYDLIFSDQLMPFCNGTDMVSAIRSKSGVNQHTPVIMISNHAMDVAEKINKLECTYLVEKPVDIKRLVRYVKMALMDQMKKEKVLEV